MKNKLTLLTAIIFAVFKLGYSQSGSIDPSFNPTDTGFGNGDGPGYIYASAIQADDKVLICTEPSLVRFNEDGTADTSFHSGLNNTETAVSIAIQPDGKIVLGISVTSAGVNPGIARLNANGSRDLTFNEGTGFSQFNSGGARTIKIQPDGKIIIGGYFYAYNGINRSNCVRLNADGSVDSSFDPGDAFSNDYNDVNSISLQADGKLIVTGEFNKKIIRLNTNGSIDGSFNVGKGLSEPLFYQSSNFSFVQPDGKIIVFGTFTSYNDTARNGIVRLNTNGSIDASFNHGTGITGKAINSIVAQPDGKILIGGDFSKYNGTSANCLARLNENGTIDVTFNKFTDFGWSFEYTLWNIKWIMLQNNGKIIIAGWFNRINGAAIVNLARIDANGSVETSYNPAGTGANNVVYDAVLQTDGKIVIGGVFSAFNGVQRSNMAKINTNGSIDTTFNAGNAFHCSFYAGIISDNNNKIIIKSITTRLNPDGTPDNTFRVSGTSDNAIFNAAIQPDGKTIFCGDFTKFNNVSTGSIFRLNSNGSMDYSFNHHPEMLGGFGSVLILPDGKVLVGGIFFNANGNKFKLFRLNEDGSYDNSFNSVPLTSDVYDMVVLPNTKLLVSCCKFSQNNQAATISRYMPNGRLDSTFITGSGTNWGSGSVINSIVPQTDGKIIVVGSFTSYNKVPCNNIIRLNSNGSIDTSFNTGIGANGIIYKAIILPDSNILIVGGFTAYNGIGRNRVAKILNKIDPMFTVSFNTDGGTPMADILATPDTTTEEPPVVPTKTGYTFAGWYKESACTNAWNFESDIVTAPITLYAKWSTSNLVNNIEADGLHIFPNPASDIIHINNIAATTEIEIYNIDGKLVKQQKVLSNNAGIDIQSLTNGLYALVIYSSEGVKSVKFVKK